MSKSKLTLIVDGNWLLMSRAAVMLSRYANMDELNRELKLLMIHSINLALRTFPTVDNVIFAADGGSWRNDEEVPECLKKKNIEYKGNRVKAEGIEWSSIFAGYKEFTNILSENGITVCREKGVEGDDWCYYWSEKLNSEGTNVIIWSKDKDLTQLVKTDSNGCFTVCWDKEPGITCQEDKESDILFLFDGEYSDNNTMFTNICNRASSVNSIRPSDVVIEKIIRGDAGDNITPIIVRKAKSDKSTKQFRVSTKDIDYSLDIHNESAIKAYIHSLFENKSYKGRIEGDETEEDVFEHFIYNRNLVLLDRSVLPESVRDTMSRYSITNLSKDFSEAESIIAAKRAGIEDILEAIE